MSSVSPSGDTEGRQRRPSASFDKKLLTVPLFMIAYSDQKNPC